MADVLTGGSGRPPGRQPPRWLVAAGVVLLAAAGLAVIAVRVADRGAGPRSATSTSEPPSSSFDGRAGRACDISGPSGTASGTSPGGVAGLVLAGVPAEITSERCDRTAIRGPWTVVVRRAGGSLGRHGAVVTFPVGGPTGGRAVEVGGVTGRAGAGLVTWPLAGGHARVRGDLPGPDLVTIATRTGVVAGRPAVRAPAGYIVAFTGPYRSPVIDENNYRAKTLGQAGTVLGPVIYTGIAHGGGVEDRLYAATSATAAGTVHGKPAVLSSVLGGNGTIAWEPAPGTIAFVGWSGSELNRTSAAAVRSLAQRTRTLTAGQWQATHPLTSDQHNQPD